MTQIAIIDAGEAVLTSLHDGLSSQGWREQSPHYLQNRIAEHGLRHVEE